MKQVQLIKIFFLALTVAFVSNEINLKHIIETNPSNIQKNTASVVHNSTVWSIDNSWYLPYAHNLKNGNGYTLDPKEPEYKVRRTPIYPLFYSSFYLLVGEESAHFFIRYLQLLFFALSAVLLSLSVYSFAGNRRWALVSGYLYALNPFIFSYCYFTITEAISPFLLTTAVFAFARFYKTKSLIPLFSCGVLVCVSFLNRPFTGLILTGFLSYFCFAGGGLWNSFKVNAKHATVLIIGFLVALSPWVIRNYSETGEIVLAEKIYHNAAMEFGEANLSLKGLVSCWINPTNYSTDVFSLKLLHNIRNGQEYQNSELISEYLNSWPDKAFQGYNKTELQNALLALNSCYLEKEKLKSDNPEVLRKDWLHLPCEKATSKMFLELQEKFKDEAPFQYWVWTPLNTMREITLNSFLHHFKIINPANSKLKFFLKVLSYILHSVYYLSLIYLLFSPKIKTEIKVVILVPIILAFLFLTVYMRYVEIRYLLPFYPLLVISLGLFIDRLFSFWLPQE